MNLIIDYDKCSACGKCVEVCIRNALKLEEDHVVEVESNCFSCGHCMAVCKNDSIRLKVYENQEDRIKEYKQRNIPIKYEDYIQFLKQRRSCRWFLNKKTVTSEEYEKLFEAAYYSPTAQNMQDVEFVVIKENLDEFLNHIYNIIKVEENKFFRIKEFGDYLKNPEEYANNPFLWEGKELILTFSTDSMNAIIAATRIELAAYTLGLGGFYSLFISKADRIDHDKLMKFFPEINPDKHMYSVFVIGHPRISYKRTIPHKKIKVTYK